MTEKQRPAPRADVRTASRAEADRRAAEILSGMGGLDDTQDEFFIDPAVVPEGWTWEWKRRTIYNQEDPAYQVQLARTGWEPVPTTAAPEMMPLGGNHPVIERKGMVLMQRPAMVTAHFRALEDKRARGQVRAKEEQLAATPQGHLPRDADPRSRPTVKKSFEPMPVPE